MLQQDDPGFIGTAVVEGPRVHVRPIAAIAAVTDDAPGRHDALASGEAQLRNPGRRSCGGLRFAGVAQGNCNRLAPGDLLLVDVPSAAPVVGRAVVVVELNDNVVTCPVTEKDGPRARLSGLGTRCATGGEILCRGLRRLTVYRNRYTRRGERDHNPKDGIQAAHRHPPPSYSKDEDSTEESVTERTVRRDPS